MAPTPFPKDQRRVLAGQVIDVKVGAPTGGGQCRPSGDGSAVAIDVGMVHQGRGLALGLKPGDDLPGVHPQLMTLSATRRRIGSSCSAM
jgi:hypothetical protein